VSSRRTICLAVVLLFALALPGFARGWTERVSVGAGVPGVQGNDDSYLGSISGDGRCVAFGSEADNLVPHDTNGSTDIFVRDRQTHTTERVSVGPLVAGQFVEANGNSSHPAISADGRFVAFDSYATNLVVGGTNGQRHIFLRDRVLHTTTLVSKTQGVEGEQANNWSYHPAISGDGRFVAFVSAADNLLGRDVHGDPLDANRCQYVFVWDRLKQAITCVSVASNGDQANAPSDSPLSLSYYGRCVTFATGATNLDPATPPDWWGGVCLHDCVNGHTEVILNEVSGGCSASITGDQHHVAFANGNIFVRDVLPGAVIGPMTQLIAGNAASDYPSFNRDGSYLSFMSSASDLMLTPDVNGCSDVFLYQLAVTPSAAATTQMDLGPLDVPANAAIASPWPDWIPDDISADGKHVAFGSVATNLIGPPVTPNVDTNGKADVFVRHWDENPSNDFTWDPPDGPPGTSITFTDLSGIMPNGPATAWVWDFGDGGTSTEQNPGHTYIAPGGYTVTLTATIAGSPVTTTKDGCITISFSDVAISPDGTSDHWAVNQILACVNAGIVGGYSDGTYRPTEPVTRDQMAVFISRALAGGDSLVPSGPPTASFSDVPVGYWAFKYVEYALGSHVVGGYSDGTYRPTTTVTRDQMAVFIARALVGGESSVPTGPSTASFPDVPTDFWAFRHIEYILSQGVTGGYPDGDYHPEYDCTRDQMAVFVQRAFDLPM